MAALLETRKLLKRFGGLSAVDGVSLAVEPGEIRGIIGPNGAGKTTLLNLISGLYPPTGGEIRLDGEPLAGLCPILPIGARPAPMRRPSRPRDCSS